ncbi:Hsp20/alpha crystallin family protein [Patulibacter minatonensis]|uniref:Hsp20/alpha crystallin family protein n=1 Tax=Patulibacter minatonensis TaxID=298163 RepID=UPI00068792EA|nr:Hsp20/alpha crystallin family protein [Patulibacter minatonensis]
MTIVRWEPAPFHAATSHDGDLVVASFSDPGASGLRAARWIPPVDLEEMDESYLLVADLPGVAHDDVAIDVDNDVLTLSGTRTTDAAGDARPFRSECDRGEFERRVNLPEGVDAEQISASLDRGVLEIAIPKPTTKRPQHGSLRLAGSSPAPGSRSGSSDAQTDGQGSASAAEERDPEPIGAAA